MVTKSIAFGPTAASADTKTGIGSETAMPQAGRIRRIRVIGYQGVTDKADSAILTLETNLQKGPWEFACGPANHEITVGGRIPTEEIEVDIPVGINEKITVSLTASEALEDCIISLTYEV